MYVLIVGPKCMLAVSHAAPGESRRVCRRDRHIKRLDGRTSDRYIKLSARRGQCNNETTDRLKYSTSNTGI